MATASGPTTKARTEPRSGEVAVKATFLSRNLSVFEPLAGNSIAASNSEKQLGELPSSFCQRPWPSGLRSSVSGLRSVLFRCREQLAELPPFCRQLDVGSWQFGRHGCVVSQGRGRHSLPPLIRWGLGRSAAWSPVCLPVNSVAVEFYCPRPFAIVCGR